ncbi:hypothetical protein FOQG_19653 [Fusarium oxysporum f. sp. raphani 54005]|uniref:Uncharacterized protein n=1 Tax=Fusarium oxysporum f. sp. raphani 54005 TaxID=1089458 RepID=X0B1F3_FUSOX|nr:hypothetical protein FOQG_19653 [Fusarium oxysporum f. sp. raphani 54005]
MRYFPQSLRWQASFIFTPNLARLNELQAMDILTEPSMEYRHSTVMSIPSLVAIQ